MVDESVYHPKYKHKDFCGPNEYGYWYEHWNEPVGTVIECAHCLRSWKAYVPTNTGYMGVLWAREGFLAKWLRRRRIRKGKIRANDG